MAEARAAQSYRESVKAQSSADATAITKLTECAEAAVAALATAADAKARTNLWRRISVYTAIAGQLQRFSGEYSTISGVPSVSMAWFSTSLFRVGRWPCGQALLQSIC